jgi:glycerol-3-phosphate dehydrogenase
MTIYDLMARYQNVASHQSLSPDAALAKEPSLAPTLVSGQARRGLRGAVLYHDCQEDDARFCLENILHAAECGAVCANYCEITRLVTRGNRIVAAQVADRLGNGETFEIAAHAFVNAAGPWVEAVASLGLFAGSRVALSPTKGVHLLLPRLTQQHAITFQSQRDGRILFILPWGECSIVGTTDTEWHGDPARARAEPADIDYLLGELKIILPGSSVEPSDVITTFAGVRSLVRSDVTNPSRRSREHRIVQDGENLLSIAGGKYTTYRAIAQEAVNHIGQMLKADLAPCRTAEMPLPNHRPRPSGEKIADSPAIYPSDIAHACEYEMAMTVSDVIRRRTGLALSRHGGPETATGIARLMATHLGWSDDQRERSLQQYLEEWRTALP